MGLFGSIGKILGKVAKTGLSVVTGGKSDLVLKVAKGIVGSGGKPKAKPAMTAADEVISHKYRPNVRITTTQATSAMPGLRTVGARSRRRRRPAAARVAARIQRRPAARGNGKRGAPRGGLDLKKIASMWRAQGKPGTWAGFIKANSHVRKAA